MANCKICQITLNKTYKFETLDQKLKNSNHAYSVVEGNVCTACNSYEIASRAGVKLVENFGFGQWKYKKHKNWNDISYQRQKNTIKFLQEKLEKLNEKAQEVEPQKPKAQGRGR